jgi:hypothetical protein
MRFCKFGKLRCSCHLRAWARGNWVVVMVNSMRSMMRQNLLHPWDCCWFVFPLNFFVWSVSPKVQSYVGFVCKLFTLLLGLWLYVLGAPGFLLVMVCDYMCGLWLYVLLDSCLWWKPETCILFHPFLKIFVSPIKWALWNQDTAVSYAWCTYINLVCFNILWLVVDWIAKTLLIHCCDIYFCGHLFNILSQTIYMCMNPEITTQCVSSKNNKAHQSPPTTFFLTLAHQFTPAYTNFHLVLHLELCNLFC